MKRKILLKMMRNVLLVLAACAFAAPVLKAQDLYVSPTELTWQATMTNEDTFYLSCYTSWYISEYGDHFEVDMTEGDGADFIHVHPVAPNTGSTDITARLVVRDVNGNWANVMLRHLAPDTDPTERISLSGNWVLSRTYTASDGSESYEDITFYDGLGYPEQVVQVGASPVSGNNIVTPLWYDNMRRADARSYLPYVSSTGTRAEVAKSAVYDAQKNWYNANGYSGQGVYAYSEQEYETSPLDRVVKSFKPGTIYASGSGNRPVTVTYSSNAAGEVRKLSVGASGGLEIGGYYSAATLHRETVTDEDGAVLSIWQDSQGRTVLSRSVAGTVNGDTYYVYDDYGNLAWVISPEGSALLSDGTWAVPSESDVNTSNAARYCYVYICDARGRQLSRKIPGKAVEYFVYDRDDRQVMSQDGLARAAGKWKTFKYDSHGRVTEVRLLSSTGTQSYFQGLFDSSNAPSAAYPSSAVLLTTVYYGSYAAANALTFSPVTGVASAIDMTRVKGLKTYEKVAVIDGSSVYGTVSSYVERAFYYDAEGRLVQTVEKNAMGTVSRYSSGYDFAGNVTATREQHGTDYSQSTYTYDGRGRLLSESTGVNGSTSARMSYSYDALGRRSVTTSGTGVNAVTVTDTYNIQGWMTGRTSAKGSTGIFNMQLRYYDATVASPRYSGDISEWGWQQGTLTSNIYAYSYDTAHRLTGAVRYSGGTAYNSFTEQGITYDRNGNVKTLARYGSGNSSPATSLSYTYSGNRRSGWGYDDNGNITSDATGNMQLSWNILDMPGKVQQGSAVKATYSYLLDGKKAGAVDASGSGFYYLGKFVYDRSKVLQEVAFGGGVVRRSSSGTMSVVDYHLKDHLGSVRAVVRDGAVVERNDYYPFGSRHANSSLAEQTTPAVNRWKFSGQEGQDVFGIPYMDFGARFYSPASVSWLSADPLAEKYYGTSPYAYCAGSPVRYSDIGGFTVRDKARGYFVGIVTNLIPGSSFLRDRYTPDDSGDYNGALFQTDAASMLIGKNLTIGGGMAMSTGAAMAAAGVGVSASVVGLPEGVTVILGGTTLMSSGATAMTAGVTLMANASSNTVGGYERGDYSYSKGNFRKNLSKRTGVDSKEFDAHHGLPVKFEDDFKKLGINIHDPKYGAWWEKHDHRAKAAQYNKEWEGYFIEKRTIEDVENKLRELSVKYEFELNF